MHTGFGGIGAGESGYGYGSNSGSCYGKETSKAYQMTKLRSANKSVAHEEAVEERDRSPVLVQTTPSESLSARPSVGTFGERNVSEAANGETTSIGSNQSRRMMTKKDIQWSIGTEQR